MRRVLPLLACTLALLVLLPGIALAHATFDVAQLPASSTQDVVLRVPLERDAANDKVEVLVPGSWTVDDCSGTDGWTCEQAETTEGDTVLTLAREGGPGDAERFALTVTAPAEEGVYSFPTIQTYDDGEEAAWIGEPGSDRPAPRIQVGDETTEVEYTGEATPHTDLASDEPTETASPTAPEEPTATAEPTAEAEPTPTAVPTEAATEDGLGDEGGADSTGTIVAIVLGVLALAGLAAVLVARRRA